MFECMNCHNITLVWQADFDFSDYGYEGEGIISEYVCSKCHARITLEVPIEEEEKSE